MLEDPAQVDWSSLGHAYGTAEEVPDLLRALISPDEPAREAALKRFYGAVLHQGSVYSSTVAAMPFLVTLAENEQNPGRAGIIGLLASIGESSSWFGEDEEVRYGTDGSEVDVAELLSRMRGLAPRFELWAADPDVAVRRAAIPATAYYPADPADVLALLRERLGIESGIAHRLLIVTTAGTLADRFPGTAGAVAQWFSTLIDDDAIDAATRLAAIAQQARSASGATTTALVSTALELLPLIAQSPAPPRDWARPDRAPEPAPTGNVPPQIVDTFEKLDHATAIYAPTTEILRTLHKAVGSRVAERSMLVTEQLRSPDPGTRLDALRMASELMRQWRGNHSALILAVAEQFDSHSPQVSAEAATTLAACHRIAGPAREILAEHVAAHYAQRGPQVWAAPRPGLRRAHQEAVQALARLGDVRALPSLIVAMDGGIDAWRAVAVAGSLPQCRAELAPRLNRYLGAIDIAGLDPHMGIGVRPIFTALGQLADPSSITPVLKVMDAAIRLEKWGFVTGGAEVLARLGAPADTAAPLLRRVIDDGDMHARSAAIAALWAIGGDVPEVLDLVLRHLAGPKKIFHFSHVAEILGEMGTDAEPAVPYLQALLGDGYEWVRIEAADALWRIVGQPVTHVVLDTLLQAWRKNPHTSNFVTATLERMGAASAPAVPDLIAELAQTRRSGRSGGIDNDEDLQAACHRLINHLKEHA